MAGRKRRLPLALLLLVLPGCDPSAGLDDEIAAEPSLRGFASCAELEGHLEARALAEMNAQIDDLIRRGPGYGPPMPLDTRTGAPTAPPAPAPTPGAGEFTTTNTQEKGVDEPDFVKNDGRRIFVLDQRQMVTVSAWPPEAARVESAIDLEGAPREMLLQGDTLLAFSTLGGHAYPVDARLVPPVPCRAPGECQARVKMSLFDVSTAAPRERYTVYVDGQPVTSRRMASRAHVVTTGALRRPDLRFWPEDPAAWQDREKWRRALEDLRRRNAKAIRERPLAEWLPRIHDTRDGGPAAPVALDCARCQATTAPVALGMTVVTTMDMAEGRAEHMAILADVDAAYASTTALYLTTPHWWRPGGNADPHLYVHRLDLADGRPRYAASGGVAGAIVDQFSLDEEEGFLRIATTIARADGSTRNLVSVLAAEGGRLRVVGEAALLAPGERIFSARFEGPRGFVVTFVQVDPLFTLDLADPRRPRVAGELKIPGFSTYLHPLGDAHLLAIGREAQPSPDGRWTFFQGLQIQVFDVSDLARPRLAHQHVFGTRSAGSEALHDHRAFTFFPSRGVLAVPLADYGARGGYRSSLEVFRVDLARGIEPLGSIEHGDLARSWAPSVRRSVMMEDYVYSIAAGGLKVSSLARPERPVATVLFPEGGR